MRGLDLLRVADVGVFFFSGAVVGTVERYMVQVLLLFGVGTSARPFRIGNKRNKRNKGGLHRAGRAIITHHCIAT